jgi:hypothetical protein
MRIHWVWVLVGFGAGAVLWPKIAPKVMGAKKGV